MLYGFETWSLTSREECRLRIFENRILRRIFRRKRNENGGERGSTMRNFMVCIVHLISVIKSRRLEGHVARMEHENLH